MFLRSAFVEVSRHSSRWRDMAEVVLEANPDATPERGVCFVSGDRMWSVARVDTRDESKGWAVWMGQRRIGDHLFFRDADVAKAFVFFVALPIRGVARALRVVAKGRRLALSAVAAAARLVGGSAPEDEQDRLLLRAEDFGDRERALAGGERLLERVAGYEFEDAPGAVAFRCLATAARLGNAPASMIAVPRSTLLLPTDIRLMRMPDGICIAGTRVQVREVVRWDRGDVNALDSTSLAPADIRAAREYAAAHPQEFSDLEAPQPEVA